MKCQATPAPIASGFRFQVVEYSSGRRLRRRLGLTEQVVLGLDRFLLEIRSKGGKRRWITQGGKVARQLRARAFDFLLVRPKGNLGHWLSSSRSAILVGSVLLEARL